MCTRIDGRNDGRVGASDGRISNAWIGNASMRERGQWREV